MKHATALERLAEVDTVVFDKTGTLTEGTPAVVNLADLTPDALSVALALAEGSSHPLAKSLTQAIQGMGIAPAAVEDLSEVPGYGSEATRQGRPVRLGRGAWVGADLPMAQTATWLDLGEGRRWRSALPMRCDRAPRR